MPSEHAEFSPSTYQYREICDFWKPDNSDEEENAMAKRGTAIHAAVEKNDLSLCLENEDVEVAKKCIRYLNHLRKTHGPDAIEFHEVRVDIFDQFGTVDFLIEDPVLSDLTDFKTGYHSVIDAEFNPQIQAYLKGTWDSRPQVDETRVHLFMPRRDEISTHVYSRAKDYDRITGRIANIIYRAKNPETYTANFKACQYCGNIGNCEAYSKMALQLATRYEPDMFVPEEIHPSNLTTPEKINLGFKFRKVLEKWNKSMYKVALDFLQSGHQLEDFKLIPVSGDRKITDPLIAWDHAQKEGITLEQFLSACSVSAPKLTDFVSKKAPRGQKGKAVDKFILDLFEANALEFGGEEFQIRAKTNKDTLQLTNE